MPPPILVVGVLLAAGQSRRMGRPKALLRCAPGSETFTERLVRTLRDGGIADLFVVGRPEDEALRHHVLGLQPPARYVENPAADRGQLSSLIVAIDEAERQRAGGVLVLPIDMPLVRSQTIAAAIAAFQSRSAPIVRVTHEGRHGHPVVFGAGVFDDLRNADISIGAKAVLRHHADHVLDLEVQDPGVLRDVDFREDYRALFGHDPE